MAAPSASLDRFIDSDMIAPSLLFWDPIGDQRMVHSLQAGFILVVAALLSGCERHPPFARPDECSEYRDSFRREHLLVLNNQKWCTFTWGATYGAGDATAQTGKVISQPLHGEARITSGTKGATYGYKPSAGYSGPDSFVIEPGLVGLSRYTIEVDVKAPAVP